VCRHCITGYIVMANLLPRACSKCGAVKASRNVDQPGLVSNAGLFAARFTLGRNAGKPAAPRKLERWKLKRYPSLKPLNAIGETAQRSWRIRDHFSLVACGASGSNITVGVFTGGLI
jgi:hypothetical protein